MSRGNTRRPRQLSLPDPPANWHLLVGGTPLEASLLWHGLARSTRSSLEPAVTSFVDFAIRSGFPAPFFPTPASHVSAWIAHEAFRIHASGNRLFDKTLSRKVTALRSWHVDLGLDPSPLASARISRVIKGAERLYGTTSRPQPLPITLPILRRVIEVIREHPNLYGGPCDALALETALLLAFGCFLRMGEFTHAVFDPEVHLMRRDVTLSTTGPSRLYLPRSKTDQNRRGTHLVIPRGPPGLCPESSLRRWLAVTPCHSPDAPLFNLAGGNFHRDRVSAFLAKALLAAGYQPSAFSGHSLRRGAATWASACGLTDEAIMILGRWSSNAYARYLDTPSQVLMDSTARLMFADSSLSSLGPDGLPTLADVWRPGRP